MIDLPWKQGCKALLLADMSFDPSIAPADKRIIQSYLQALQTFLNLRGPIPLRELVVFYSSPWTKVTKRSSMPIGSRFIGL
jgi:hypothetical protein